MEPLWVFSWCYNLSLPLGNQVVYCLWLLVPTLFTVYALSAKAFVSITLPRVVDRGTLFTPKPVFYMEFTLFLDGFSVKQDI